MEAGIISTGSFPPMGRSQWLESARPQAEMPGSSLASDFRLQQMHRERTGSRLLASGGVGWTVVQRVDDVDAKRANAQAQEDLAAGASGLAIVFEGAPNAFGYGLPARPEALAAALHNIPVHKTYLRIDVHPSSRASVDWIVEIMRRKKVDPAKLNLSFGIDPAAIYAGNGNLRMSIEALHASMPQSLAHFFAMGMPAVLLEADGRVMHNAGASEAQELGVMIASAVSYLRMFQEARQPLVYATPHIGFALCVDQDPVFSLAKVRAMRRLWAKVQEACGIAPSTARIHVETSFRMMSCRDVETNLLRTTLAASSAVAGGADTISVLPHTLAHGLPERRARRLARDIQLVLARESRLAMPADLGGGSDELEQIVATMCEAAWEEFRTIEAEGGLLTSLSKGLVQKRVREACAQRVEALRAMGAVPDHSADDEAVAVLKAERKPVPAEGVAFCDPLPAVRLDELVSKAETN